MDNAPFIYLMGFDMVNLVRNFNALASKIFRFNLKLLLMNSNFM